LPRYLPVAVLLAAALLGCGQTEMAMGPAPAAVVAPAPAHAVAGSGPAAAAQPEVSAAPSATAAPASADPSLHLPTPAHVRGIYLTGWTAGSPSALQRLIAYVRRNGLNTMVIDVKDNDGRLSFPLPGTAAEAMGADGHKIADVASLLSTLHRDGIYVIGRVVAFADPYLAAKRPDWAIHNPDGTLWRDPHGQPWIDPASQAVWAYNVEIGAAAARLGFDEIQYDYVRLPEERIPGYNVGNAPADREAPVDGFLRLATRAITDVPVSADVFAIDAVAVNPEDGYIGQDYTQIAHIVPVISPMAYPSLYAPGEFGIANPNARPYDTVWETLASAEARTADLPRTGIRPWIQDYDLGRPAYGPAQVDAELQALAAAGIRSFLMWNAGNVYTEGIDFGLIDRTPEATPSPAWLPAAYALIRSGVPVWLPAEVPDAPAYSVTATADASGYAVALWATRTPLPANDPGAIAGQPLLEVSGARDLEGLAPLPATIDPDPPAAATGSVTLADGAVAAVGPAGGGIRLTWRAGGLAFQVWGPDLATARAAADSMQRTPLVEGR
jgi:hypothetical protein